MNMTARDIAIEEGIASVLNCENPEWRRAYLELVAQFLKERKKTTWGTFHGGQVCDYCRDRGLEEPHHHNVWGAMLTVVKKLGWARKIGYTEPDTRQSHIKQVVLWEVTL